MKVCRVEVIGKQSIVQAAKHGGSKSSLSKRMLNKKTLLMGLLEQWYTWGPQDKLRVMEIHHSTVNGYRIPGPEFRNL